MVKLANRSAEVLVYVRQNPGSTPTEISEALGLQLSNTSLYLKELRKRGQVKFKFKGNALHREYEAT